MFRKIVSNLPFSPALVGQLGVYSKRLNREEKTRLIGLFFLILTLGVQLVAAIQPSESANASDAKSFNAITTAHDNNITQSLIANNLSQGYVDASSVTAQASDQINFIANIKNVGQVSIKSRATIPISDILDYATIIDTGGGIIDKTEGTISWAESTIKANDSQTRSFVAKVLDTIPATAQGVNNKNSFDCKITSTFGNPINIAVECPTQKIIERIDSQLPKTNVSNGILFTGFIFTIAIYLYVRTIQINKEVRLIRKDSSTGTI